MLFPALGDLTRFSELEDVLCFIKIVVMESLHEISHSRN